MKKIPEIEKFLCRVIYRPDGCWGWRGPINNVWGYSQFRPYHNKRQPTVRAHRWIYKLYRGPTTPGLVLDHLCNNRWCVNPMHLQEVPQRVNRRRAANVRLTSDDVRSIRLATRVGIYSGEIAKRFNISQDHVWGISRRKRWAVE